MARSPPPFALPPPGNTLEDDLLRLQGLLHEKRAGDTLKLVVVRHADLESHGKLRAEEAAARAARAARQAGVAALDAALSVEKRTLRSMACGWGQIDGWGYGPEESGGGGATGPMERVGKKGVSHCAAL